MRSLNSAVCPRIALIILMVSSATTLAVGAKVISLKETGVIKPVIAPPQPPMSVAPANDNQSPITALPIMLKPFGFVPSEITKPAGDYLFSVGNQSAVSEITLRLDADHGNRLHEASVKQQRLRWRQIVLLTPGTYFLTEANH